MYPGFPLAPTRCPDQPPRGNRTARSLLLIGIFASSLLSFRLVGVAIGDVLLLVSLALCILTWRPHRRTESLIPVSSFLTLLALLVGATLSAHESMSASQNYAVLFRLVFLVLALPWQIRILLPTDRDQASALVALALGGGAAALGTVLQVAVGTVPLAYEGTSGRLAGFTTSVSDLGGVAAVSAIAAVCAWSSATAGRYIRPLLGVALAASVLGLVLSGSVSGMAAFLIGAAFAMWNRSLSPKAFGAFSAMVILAFLLAVALQASESESLTPIERLSQTLGLSSTGTQYNTSESRVETYRIGLEGFLNSPFSGVGLDQTSGEFRLHYETLGVHNLLIAAAFQGGLFLVCALGYRLIQAGRAALNRTGTGAYSAPLFVTAFVFSMTAPSLYNRYLWIPVGLLVVASQRTPSVKIRPSQRTDEK